MNVAEAKGSLLDDRAIMFHAVALSAATVLADEVDRLETQLVRVRAEYAAALTRITDAQLTVEACDRLLAAIREECDPAPKVRLDPEPMFGKLDRAPGADEAFPDEMIVGTRAFRRKRKRKHQDRVDRAVLPPRDASPTSTVTGTAPDRSGPINAPTQKDGAA